MKRSGRIRSMGVVGAAALLTLMTVASAGSAQPGAPPVDLDKRLKLLEEQNQKLQKQLEDVLKATGSVPTPAPPPPAPAEDPKKVETIVNDILKKKEEVK